MYNVWVLSVKDGTIELVLLQSHPSVYNQASALPRCKEACPCVCGFIGYGRNATQCFARIACSFIAFTCRKIKCEHLCQR